MERWFITGCTAVYLIMPDGYPGDVFMDEVVQTLEARFSAHHSTLQIEQGTTPHTCSLAVTASVQHSYSACP
jgi:cobalt-zinc-cadmium efflux system protein